MFKYRNNQMLNLFVWSVSIFFGVSETFALGQRNRGDSDRLFINSSENGSEINARSISMNFGGKNQIENVNLGGGQIVFPSSSTNNQRHTYKFKKYEDKFEPGQGSEEISSPARVPNAVLIALSKEIDFGNIVKTYVRNAKIQNNETTGEQILVDEEGDLLTDSRGNKIIVSMMSAPGTRTIINTLPDPRSNYSSIALNSHSGIKINGRMGPKTTTESKSPAIAVCKPEEQTISVPVTFDPHIIYHPRCVRIERCGGCCGSDILACEPSEITTVNVPVRKFSYVVGGDRNLEFLEQQEVVMEKHTKCECRCRTKEQDCGSQHEYKEGECLCVCRDTESHQSCVADAQKVWDPSSCECLCREIKDCNSGFMFNLHTCTCTPVPGRKRGRRNNNSKKQT